MLRLIFLKIVFYLFSVFYFDNIGKRNDLNVLIEPI